MSKKDLISVKPIIIIICITIIAVFFILFLLYVDLEQLSYHLTSSNDLKPDIASSAVFPWNASNRLAFEMYDMLNKEGENVFFSPIVMMITMAALYEGTDGQNAANIMDTFDLPSDDEYRRNAFKPIVESYDECSSVCIKNTLWINNETAVNEDLADILSEYYGISIKHTSLNNSKNYDLINDWAHNVTNTNSPRMLFDPAIESVPDSIFTSVAYYNGVWKNEFFSRVDKGKYFWPTPENKRISGFMLNFHILNYTVTDIVKIIQIPYKEERFSMLVILPNSPERIQMEEKYINRIKPILNSPERMALLEENLSLENLSRWVLDLSPTYVNIQMPTLSMNKNYDLIPFLRESKAGQSSDTKNFVRSSNMSIHVDAVNHFTIIGTNVSGTATKISPLHLDWKSPLSYIISLDGEYPNEKFHAQEPFIFIIWDSQTQGIIFMGKVSNPDLHT